MAVVAAGYYKYGRVCGRYPWHILMSVFSLLSLVISRTVTSDAATPPTESREVSGLDLVIVTLARVFSILSLYSQMEMIRRMGLRHILYLSLLFSLSSGVLFSTLVGCSLGSIHWSDMLPFFLLLVDIPKTVLLGKAVLTINTSSKSSFRVALGDNMLKFGPIYTLNSLVAGLLLSMGLILRVKSLFLVCYLGILVTLSNFLVTMTIYPTFLLLFGEVLVYAAKPVSKIKEFIIDTQQIQCDFLLAKSSGAMVKIKLIMSAGVLIVHLMNKLKGSPELPAQDDSPLLPTDLETIELLGGLTLTTQHVILLILTAALTLRFYISEYYHPSETDGQPSHSSERSAAISKQHSIDRPEDSEDPASGLRQRFTLSERTPSVAADNPLYSRSVSWSNNQMDSIRTLEECLDILESEEDGGGIHQLSDLEIVQLVKNKTIAAYNLETRLPALRAVCIRRELISQLSQSPALFNLPYKDFSYELVNGACCENVVGFVGVPVGVVGPLLVNGKSVYVPLATTEGALVASTNRGCKALSAGVDVHVQDLGMTRAPAVKFSDVKQASVLCHWLRDPHNLALLQQVVSEKSRFTRLQSVTPTMAGRTVFIRFQATTGDAMGMNMVSAGVERCLKYLQAQFPAMRVVSVSGNYCTDKKPAAINWVNGRGKKVVAEAVISKDVVEKQLKTSVRALVELNTTKNLIGSAMAGCSAGGFNAHAANLVAALFIATGQDPAQVVASSNCITQLEPHGAGDAALHMSVTMPSVELGTLGGGTRLPAQQAALGMLGVSGPSVEGQSQTNAMQLAAILGAVVLAGELSLLSALSTGDLVKSHLNLNRNSTSTTKQ